MSWWDVTMITNRRNICCKSRRLQMWDRDALRSCDAVVKKSSFDVFQRYAYGSSINLKGSEARDHVLSRLTSSFSLSLSLSLSVSLSLVPFSPTSSEGREWTSLVLSELTFKVSDWNCYGDYTKNHSTSAIDRCWERIDLFLSSRIKIWFANELITRR